jgi:hypothetical protein
MKKKPTRTPQQHHTTTIKKVTTTTAAAAPAGGDGARLSSSSVSTTAAPPSPSSAAAPAAPPLVRVPASIHEVDNGKILGFGADLAEDHPGFHDAAYKRRRAAIADLARAHEMCAVCGWLVFCCLLGDRLLFFQGKQQLACRCV